MTTGEELRSLIEQLSAIRSRAEDSYGTEELPVRDRPRLQRLLTEAKTIISEELGEENDFAGYLRQTIDRTMHRGASPAHADEGLEFVEGALNQIRRKRLRERGYDEEDIPASDRYVGIKHNQREDLQADLKALEDQVRGDNEVSPLDRDIALSEIAVFEAAILAPRIPTDLIQRFVDQVLKWLTKTFSNAAVGVVATKLVEALMPLLG